MQSDFKADLFGAFHSWAKNFSFRKSNLLRTVKVHEIAQAMQVSQPYAAFIRAGRRRPHPRHWQVLAELVGVRHMQPEYLIRKVPCVAPRLIHWPVLS